jgi:hypothetical protein
MADTKNRVLDAFASTLGALLHAGLLLVFLTMGLVVPAWFVGVLLATWVVLVIAAIRMRANELYLLLAPIVAVVVMIIVISIGESAFDWTA